MEQPAACPDAEGGRVRILLAEDDDDDYFLTQQALQQNRVLNELYRVKDGEELMDFLRHQGRFSVDGRQSTVDGEQCSATATAVNRRSPAVDVPWEPSLILLDLNMPRKDGREALREIKSDPLLRRYPVVVLTTSHAEEDVVRSYELGMNSFITKPVTFQGLVEAVRILGRYWFEIVELPS